jgi:HK97 family phage major capsid protein
MQSFKTAALLGSAAMLAAAPRAVHATPRAEGNDIKALTGQIQSIFAEFKAENDKLLAGKADVVLSEKVDKMNDAIGKIEASIDEHATKLAASKLDAGIGDLPASTPEEVSAFKAHMRSGDLNASLKKSPDSDGGYLAPIEWDRTITGRLKQISPIREDARVITIGTAGFKKLFTDRAIGSGWVGETAARPETATPTFGQLDFTPGELYANPAASQQMLEDAAVDIEQWLAGEVELEFARQEGIAFLAGDGTNKPYGILTYVAGAANAARHPWGAIQVVNSGAAAALTGDGLLGLIYALPAEYEAGSKLYMNRSSAGAARKLKDGQGNYLWQPAFEAGQPATLAGVPIKDVPGMPNVAAGNIAALYGNMEMTYLVIDRIGVSVLRDPYTNKPFVMFYTRKRVGGGVQNPDPMRALLVSA